MEIIGFYKNFEKYYKNGTKIWKIKNQNLYKFFKKNQEIIYKIRNYIKILKKILIKEHPMS